MAELGRRTTSRGFFSIVRWISDPTRDEARNVAIIVLDEAGRFGEIRSAPVSRLSPKLHEQGLLDALLVGLSTQLESRPRLTHSRLLSLHGQLHQSLQITEPKPVALDNSETAIDALYRAYLAPPPGGPRSLTKGALLDQVIQALRAQGKTVQRGAYIGDFIFDAVLTGAPGPTAVVSVLSFGAARKDWTPVERDAGHFLFAISDLAVNPQAVIEPPGPTANGEAKRSHQRVEGWLRRADIPVRAPADLKTEQLVLT